MTKSQFYGFLRDCQFSQAVSSHQQDKEKQASSQHFAFTDS